MVNYEEAIKKPFTDIGRLILGIVLSLIPIVNWIAQGFILESSGVGKTKPSKNMPEWKDLGDYFIKGFLSFVITFIYMLPAIILFISIAGYAAVSLMAAFGGVMPEGFISAMAAGNLPRGEIAQFFSQNWMLALPTLVNLAPLILLGLFLLLVAIYLSPIAILNYLKNKKFGKAFEFSFVFKKAFTIKYFIVWILAGVIGLVLKTILSFIPWIGAAITFFITGVIAYSLYGQVFREK